MEIEVDEDLLRTVAAGGQMDYGLWPALSQGIISRLDKIAHNEFPIPNLPPPQPINPSGQQQPRLLSPLPSSSIEPASSQPSPQDADKENSQPNAPTTAPTADSDATATAAAGPAPGTLPAQIEAMLVEINSILSTFPKYPPHTIQRLAELVLEPRRHYRHLASYLHAVDRVVHVTSGANIYPLPPAIPDMSTMTLLSNGSPSSSNGQQQDPAAAVSWGNSTNSVASTVGTDEALGGALLTPIPWLTRRPSPGSASPASSNGGGPAEIRTESTETIDGPNGVGSIETVSVSVNGIPSMGAHMINTSSSAANRGITQGELLRQEQEQGVVPVNQLARKAEAEAHAAALRNSGGGGGDGGAAGANSPEKAEEENEAPHVRGPEEIGVDDLGPQTPTTSYLGEDGIEMQGIDVEAAVGRKAEQPRATPPPEVEQDAPAATEDAAVADDAASETSTTSHGKRDANEELEGLASKKIKEDDGDVATAGEAPGAAAGNAEAKEKDEEKEAAKAKAEPEDEEMKKPGDDDDKKEEAGGQAGAAAAVTKEEDKTDG